SWAPCYGRGTAPSRACDVTPTRSVVTRHMLRMISGGRKRLDELDVARLLVRRQVRTAVRDQLVTRGGRARLQDHDRLHRLSPLDIRNADHLAIGHRGVAPQTRLDFRGI